MLPAKLRLKNKKEFASVFRWGKVSSNDVLAVKYSPIEPGQLKVGFSVGLKFSKKSSKRNKVKRWMREAIRPMLSKIKPGHSLIFLVNSRFSYEQMNFPLIQEKVKDLLGKAKLFK